MWDSGVLRRARDCLSRLRLKRGRPVLPGKNKPGQRCRRFIHANWVTITASLLSVGLCALLLFMLLSRLPGLPIPDFARAASVASAATEARATAPLNVYLQPLKVRDLFKPSIPIPAGKKIGKTTAEQLAQRLQFLGTSGDAQNLSALIFIPERGPASFQAGDRVAEFVLIEIRNDSLVLELEDEQVVVKR
jgi:hypothetical protein